MGSFQIVLTISFLLVTIGAAIDISSDKVEIEVPCRADLGHIIKDSICIKEIIENDSIRRLPHIFFGLSVLNMIVVPLILFALQDRYDSNLRGKK